jgi:outer membrane lipoprotein carrier protein
MKDMFRYILMTFFTCLIFFANRGEAAPAAELAHFLNDMRTMKADFTQITYDNHHKPVQQSYGRMALHRPGQFRWEVTKPVPQLMIANDARLWIYDEDLEQVTIRPLNRVAGETPGLLLSHVETNLEKHFTITLLDESSTQKQWFLLIPKGPDSLFASITMGFTKGRIVEMRLQDHLGHMTRILFNKIQVNTQLPSSLFVFKSPAHVDVIDETKKT